MRPFDFYAPTTVVEALTLLDQYKDSVACIAGGTDLTLELNEWKAQPASSGSVLLLLMQR